MLPHLISRALLPSVAAVAVVATAVVSSPTVSGAASASAAQDKHTNNSDSTGFYTEAQAARGLTVYKAVCAECHEVQDFSNKDFRAKWDGNSLFALYENIRTTMPEENPGTLSREQYADVVTYVLKLNALPPGQAEFTADSASASTAILQLLPKNK